MKNLEHERQQLERLVAAAESPSRRLDLSEIKKQIPDLVLHFEARFQNAPIEERKELVQRCIFKNRG